MLLQDTVTEKTKEVQNTRSGEIKKTTEDVDEFFLARQAYIVSFLLSELNPLTASISEYVQTYGNPTLWNRCLPLLNQKKRLQWIKNDDKMIQAEGGVDALSEDELHEDCRERGMFGQWASSDDEDEIDAMDQDQDNESGKSARSFREKRRAHYDEKQSIIDGVFTNHVECSVTYTNDKACDDYANFLKLIILFFILIIFLIL
uniref:Letm1 RBD domain-containing protein n=1 Tax=Lactuca sativa TaxID=4236 RepID=A0A9R1V0F2_LACSA|nr:hypothetical protein LSAT_V11C700349560 [Lactuca sativa]